MNVIRSEDIITVIRSIKKEIIIINRAGEYSRYINVDTNQNTLITRRAIVMHVDYINRSIYYILNLIDRQFNRARITLIKFDNID